MPKLVDVIIVNGGHLAKPSGFYRFFSLFRDGGEGGGPPPATTPRDHSPGGPWGKLKGVWLYRARREPGRTSLEDGE